MLAYAEEDEITPGDLVSLLSLFPSFMRLEEEHVFCGPTIST